MVTVKLGDILQGVRAEVRDGQQVLAGFLIDILAARYKPGALPLGKVLFDFERALKCVEDAFNGYEKARQKLVGAMDEDDADWRKDEAKMVQFFEEIAALQGKEVEIKGLPISGSILDQAVGLEFSPADLRAVKWMFEVEGEQVEASASEVPTIAGRRAKKAKA